MTIAFPFWAGQLTVLGGWILFRLFAYLQNKKINWKSEAVQILFLVNLLVIYRITFHPFAKVDGQVQPLLLDPGRIWPFWINITPLIHLLEYPTLKEILINVIGNSTMFIPTGILTPLLYRNLRSFPKTLRTGFLISLTIELLQLPFFGRCSDIDDLLLNTAGCAAGWGILFLWSKLRRKDKKPL